MNKKLNSGNNYLLSCVSLLLSTLLVTGLNAQDIATDNEGKPIFTIPSNKVIMPEAALKNLGVSFTAFHIRKRNYYILDGAVRNYTMKKSTTVNFKANIINNDDDILLVGKNMNVTPHFEIGLNRGIDELISPTRVGRYYTLSGAIFADLQHFDLYDTLNKKFLDKYRRVSYGARMSFNIFHKSFWAVAINLSYKNSIETDDLASYQKRSSNEIYVDNNIGTNGSSDGYISPITPTNNYRFSIANPYFIGRAKLAIIPFYFIKFGQGLTPKNNAGVVFSFMNQQFRNFDKTTDGSINQTKKFEFETAFSVGVNIISTGTEKHNYVFISGTASFGSTKTKDDKDKSGKNKFL